MTTMNLTIESDLIAASAEEVWRITAVDFDQVANWASGLSASKSDDQLPVPDGATVGGRICEVPGSGELFERLISFSEPRRTFAFSATPAKAPSFLNDFRMYWQITARSADSTVATGEVVAELDGYLGWLMKPMMKMAVKKTMSDLMGDLKVHAETGGVSPKKQKALKKLAKNS